MNIFTALKNDLGYTNVTNQYIELSHRIITERFDEMASDIHEIKVIAKEYGLNLTEIPDTISQRFSGNYIINIHSSFMLFLERFAGLNGSPMKHAPLNTSEEDELSWILNWVYKYGMPEEVRHLYFICDYYRLARNVIIHGEITDSSSELRLAFSKIANRDKNWIKQYIGKLDAPNEVPSISFDDQVLFSKAVYELSQRIYQDADYDLPLHVNKDIENVKKMIKPYINNKKRVSKMIQNYLLTNYPIYQDRYKAIISDIVDELI